MNIFVLDACPERAARQHCDRHVVKMVLETAQLLSTVLWQRDQAAAARLARRGVLYRPTHPHHPCAVWAGATAGNFAWLCRLGAALAAEYAHRYGKLHRSAAVIAAARAWAEQATGKTGPAGATPSAVKSWPRRRTAFAQAMPEQYRGADAVAAYRAYYIGDKARICRWTRRPVPRWFAAAPPGTDRRS